MENELVSIITLCYNNSQYYKKCLESILCQTYKQIELLIVDDCSRQFNKDEIVDFIENNNINNIKYSIKENKCNIGIVKNYNDCIRRAKGKYIFYLCIDDALYDNKVIEDVVKYFQENDVDIFTGYAEIYDENLEKYLRTYPDEQMSKTIKSSSTKQMLDLMMQFNVFLGACTPFRRDIVDKIGMIDERFILLEDYPRYIKILKQGIPIKFIERKLIKYRIGGITTSETKNPIFEEDMIKVKELYIKKYIESREENFDYKGKIQVGWGTSKGFFDSYKSLEEKINYPIEFLLDSNEQKHGEIIDGKKVCDPKNILSVDKGKIFIWIFSECYFSEISSVLEEHGYIEFIDFARGTKDYIVAK